MNNFWKLRTTLNFFVILLAGWSADATELNLKPQVTSGGGLVLLSDVATVTCEDEELRSRLEQVELFPAPAAGRSRTMRIRELYELLTLQGFDVSTLQVSGATATRVLPAPRSSPAKIEPAPTVPAEPTPAVLVATRALQPGDVLREADVELRPLPTTPRGTTTATRTADVVGQEVQRAIADGDPIDLRNLRRPLLVQRGELIRIRARAAGVQVTTTAKALEPGAIGDLILVQSLENNAKYSAHVTGSQQADVYASGYVVSSPPDNPASQIVTPSPRISER